MNIRICVCLWLALMPWAALSQQKGNPAAPCFRALADDARFAPIRDKVALGGSIEEMRSRTSSNERAKGEEGAALGAWRSAREGCHRQEAGYYATRDVQIQALAREHFAAVQSLIGDLQAGKLSYGEFGRRRVELYEQVTRQIEEVRRAILPPKPVPQAPSPGK